MKLKKLVIIHGTMTAVSGLHIGGNSSGTKVGGCDNPVIRDPLTDRPYIPGTSLKGCMRTIAEKTDKSVNITSGKPCGCGKPTCMVCTLFGAHMNTRAQSGEPRLMVRDMKINEKFMKKFIEDGQDMSSLVETKASTMIDRNTNTASNGSLRNMERVAAGTVFDCEFVLKVFDNDDEKKMLYALSNIIENIEIVGIGAKTTSGSGQVKFDIDWDHAEEISC